MKKTLSLILILQFFYHFVSARQLDTVIKSGHITNDKIFKLLYVPFDVPEGTTEIRVKERYDDMNHNVFNLGIYGPQGHEVGNVSGFRGWSGGAKKEFFINEGEASAGYIAGTIKAGTWNVLVYPSAIALAGLNWTLEITLVSGKHQKIFEIRPAATQVNVIAGWYRGDLHMHTLHSDGKRTVEQLVTEAKTKKLNYIISTEHNTNSANLSWGKYDSKNLLIINGEEVTTTAYGHWNAIGLQPETVIDWRYIPEDQVIEKYIEQVHQDNGLAIINHPFFDKGDKTFKFEIQEFDGIEIWNGQWNKLNELALQWWDGLLQKKLRKTAIGASDTHTISGSANNLGRPQTVVYANALSRNGIIEGIKKGRVYLAATDSVLLKFEVRSAGETANIGETLAQHSDPLIHVYLDIKGCENSVMTLIGSKGLLFKIPVTSDSKMIRLKVKRGSTFYIRAEIRKLDGKMLALTNPIWLN
ncbi:CehA/McbA family metallohydrolase [Pedobacter sp. L105]|uniref:CehA/McbA family metallohydrolase n=1 Tax=Pedobacter sp. L105 TaxID=1641871 RepID=UPI00131E192C|nr:CehA/McbA family metallohydrolase [Pedobacter sp. L105]